MYTPEGVSEGVEFFPTSPAIVAVDTRSVAEAPVRYLVAGMGDAEVQIGPVSGLSPREELQVCQLKACDTQLAAAPFQQLKPHQINMQLVIQTTRVN